MKSSKQIELDFWRMVQKMMGSQTRYEMEYLKMEATRLLQAFERQWRRENEAGKFW